MAKLSSQKIIRKLFQISLPKMWFATGLAYIFGLIYSGASWSINSTIGLLFYLLSINILFYGLDEVNSVAKPNQVQTEANPPSTSTQPTPKNNSQQKLLLTILVINLPIIILCLFLFSTAAKISFIANILVVLAYTMPPIRLRNKAILDGVFSGLRFPLAFATGFLLHGQGKLAWAIAVSLLFWGIASHGIFSILQLRNTRALGFDSMAAKLGIRRTSRITLFCFIVSTIIIAATYFPGGLIAAGMLSFFALNAGFFIRYKSDAQVNKFKRAWYNHQWLTVIIGLWLLILLLFFGPNAGQSLNSAIVYCSIVILLTVFQLIIYLNNLGGFRMPKPARLEEWPRISVLIHAHNQADNIASTILAVIGQNYPNFEIIFTDLDSDDNTRSIVESYQDKKLKIISIEPPPTGWSLNSWAAMQMNQHASGDICLLLGADTVLLPNALSTIASLMFDDKKLDLISLLPADQDKTLAQKLILSQNQAVLLTTFPAAFIAQRYPKFAASFGGVTAYSRTKIETISGFELVKASPLEDNDLGREAKLRGLNTAFYIATELAISQNHADLAHILSQNLQRYYPSMRFNFPFAANSIIGGLVIFSGPLALLILAAATAQFTLLPIILLTLGLQISLRIIVSLRSKQNILSAIAFPLSNLVAITTLVFSILRYELLRPRWQKRTELSVW